jgi:diguanylate cyclase (GGDEF)-like protein
MTSMLLYHRNDIFVTQTCNHRDIQPEDIMTPHQGKLVLLAALANLVLVFSLALGDIKMWGELDWLDLIGEGGAVLFSLLWIFLILSSRPAGRVTSLLFYGLTLIFVSGWQDWLDEIIQMPPHQPWNSLVESFTMPAGIVFLTIGMFQWRQEQLTINEQLRKREQLFRDHRRVDLVTQVGAAPYFREHLQLALEQHEQSGKPVSVMMLDVDGFDRINRRIGMAEGDRMLHEIAEVIMLNLRRDDLLCRYAGDRFALILPQTNEQSAKALAQELRQAAAHFAFKTAAGESVFASLTAGFVMWRDETTEELEEHVNRRLARAKDERQAHSSIAVA